MWVDVVPFHNRRTRRRAMTEQILRKQAADRGLDAEATEDFVKKGLEWWENTGVKAVVSETSGKSKYTSDR
jgi:hypothetical protein